MKTLIVFLILSSSTLFASVNAVKSKLISQIAQVLLPNKTIFLYVKDEKYKSLSNLSYRIRTVDSLSEANLILTDEKPRYMSSKALLFFTTYAGYKSSPKAVGALFWQKGRPNLIFNKKRLEELKINLPNSFERYVE